MIDLPPNLLKTLNLSEAESKVYLAALELGQTNLLALSKKSRVKRSTIYTFLDNLIERGLLFETSRKKRKVYSAAHPNQLVELEKIHLAELNQLLPELLAVYNKSDKKPRVTFYNGIEGIKEVYADTLKEKQPMKGWSDYEQSLKILGTFYDTYGDERAKRGILYQGIARDTIAARQKVKLSNRQLREIKLTNLDELTTELYIYANKVALVSFRSNPPLAIVVEDENISDTLRVIWQDAWGKLSN